MVEVVVLYDFIIELYAYGGKCLLWMFLWLSAIAPMIFCRFWEPYRVGEVLPKFLIDNINFLSFLQRRCRRSGDRVARSSSSLLHRLATALLP